MWQLLDKALNLIIQVQVAQDLLERQLWQNVHLPLRVRFRLQIDFRLGLNSKSFYAWLQLQIGCLSVEVGLEEIAFIGISLAFADSAGCKHSANYFQSTATCRLSVITRPGTQLLLVVRITDPLALIFKN